MSFYTFDVDNNQIFRLDGNVGIGTDNPGEKLDIVGNIKVRNSGSIFIGDSITDSLRMHHLSDGNSYIDYNSDQNLYFRKTTPGTNTDVLTLDNNGNVGIGTYNPRCELDVSGEIYASSTITGNLTGNVTGSSGSCTGNAATVTNGVYTTGDQTIGGVKTFSSDIIANSNVGIGTIAPSEALDVSGNIRCFNSSSGGGVTFKGDADYTNLIGERHVYIKANGKSGVAHNDGHIIFVPGNGVGEKVRINKDGNLGIGTDSPGYPLQVMGTISGKNFRSSGMHNFTKQSLLQGAYVSWNDDNGGGEVDFICSKGGGVGGFNFFNVASGTVQSNLATALMKIDHNGNVGIGTDNPGYPLDIKGYIDLGGTKSVYFSTGSNPQSYTGDSKITIQSEFDVKASAYIATSDERIKKDILDINDDAALQKLRIIEPKTYKYKDVATRGTKTVFGFIAQQIDTVLPEAVSKLNDVIPNTYELCDATSSSNNDYYDTITFTNFNTANLDASSNNLVLVDANNKNHSVNITAVLDSSSVQVDTDLTEWMGVIDASNETVIANEVQKYKKVILDANNNVVLENYDITTIASMDASENVVGKMADLSGDNTIDSSNNYVDASGNFIAGPINTDGHYIDASGNYFDADGNFKDASGTLIGTYKAEWKKVITINGTKIFVYGQTVNDFHALNKDYIFTVATAALQEVDRQLQAEKTKTATLETEVSTLKTQMADILARVTALESA